jgi:hypothetical protein
MTYIGYVDFYTGRQGGVWRQLFLSFWTTIRFPHNERIIQFMTSTLPKRYSVTSSV